MISETSKCRLTNETRVVVVTNVAETDINFDFVNSDNLSL